MPRTFNGQSLYFRDNVVTAFWDGTPFHEAPDPSGRTIRWWQCFTCNNWNTYEGIQMGHRTEWALYFDQNGIDPHTSTYEEAMDCFNDLTNLAPQCATCNQGHDFEYRNWHGEEIGEPYSDEEVDEEGNLVGFVVPDDQCPACESDNTADNGGGFYHCMDCGHGWSTNY